MIIGTRFQYFMEAFSEIKGKEFLEIQNLILSQLFKKNSILRISELYSDPNF